MDRGDKESTTDRTTTTMNERGAKLGRIAPLPLPLPLLRLEQSGNFLGGSVYGDVRVRNQKMKGKPFKAR